MAEPTFSSGWARSLAGSPDEFRPPRPLRASVLPLAPMPLAVALWLWGVVPVLAALVMLAALSLAALVRACAGAYELHRLRRLGDALLRASPSLPPASGLAAWRSAKLTGAQSRRQLGGWVHQLKREVRACTGPGASPQQNTALEESDAVLRRLEYRLNDAARPLSPLGMLELRALVSGDLSPLYYPKRADDLTAELSRALAALEPA